MIVLTDPLWDKATSAYGNVKELLEQLLASLELPKEDRIRIIDDLSSTLNHQLMFYSATAFVLPYLADFVQKLSVDEQVHLLGEIGAAIVPAVTAPIVEGSIEEQEFTSGLNKLKPLMHQLVLSPLVQEYLANNPHYQREFALTAVAILGSLQHAYLLYILFSYLFEETFLACDCGWSEEGIELFLENDLFVQAKIDAWDGKSFQDEAVWLHGFLDKIKEQYLNSILPIIYGQVVCPECGKKDSFFNCFERYDIEG